ncbi:DUF1573 domain-containing protein [Bacteroidales bacterium]|uniref:DUF1573 domain-containing protein n=1 Tax=Lepagella muris TaxID=3032870 RepID=A0AC61RG75_9BACT|nr:DUF1573 domain-containing protein [Lepagella muris]THG52326.1 DUF1573 domain-containing protein [Bacteroidales bacterium]TKC57939.1 DUF1573 domain-containing protein [Bacteroidales bacterium]
MNQDTINFEIFNNKIQTRTIGFTNTGTAPIVVTRVFSDCGCTAASYTKGEIAPGERGEVTVRFNGKGRTHGRFQEVVRIKTNAKNRQVLIIVSGIIKQKYRKSE